MKIRVIYDNSEIISVDKPEGAAAIDYDLMNLVIEEHLVLLPLFYNNGYDVSKISEFLISNGVEIENPEWLPKPII